LVLKENKKILDSTLATVQEMLDLTKKLVAEEVMVRSNAVQLELSVLQMQNAITQVESQIILAGNLLKFQMGMEITKDIEVVGELVNVSDEVSTSFEPSQNIDYQILSVQKELNLLNVKNKQANYLPSVSTFLTHQQVAQRNETDFFNGDKPWFPTTIWGVQLSIPIFSSGMRMSQVSQAKLELEKSENSLAQLDEALKLQISQALTNYKLAKASVELKLKAIDAARLVFNDNRILYNEGALSSLELTQSQNQLLMQQTEYTNAYFELIKAKIALEKLMNKL
ncbi:MAG: TolC family protein, partial [Flavobacteriales bacterium]|nr:TolC family protein [Flavobacteriales bacterium]